MRDLGVDRPPLGPRGPDQPQAAVLELLASALKLTSAAWVERGAPPVLVGLCASERLWNRSLDWALANSLQPGQVVIRSAEYRCPVPTLSINTPVAIYIRPLDPTGGFSFLHFISPRSWRGTRVQLLQLAEWWVGYRCAYLRACEQKRSRLEQRIGRSAAALTHDLRNQLSLAGLQLERFLEEGAWDRLSPAERQSLLGELDQSIRGARNLCKATLSGEQIERRTRIRLRECLLTQARQANSLSGRSSTVRLRVQCPANLELMGDRNCLERLIQNLLLNAFHASFDGGLVSVTARQLGSRLQVVVVDAGRGMNDQTRARWLDAGHSASGSTGYGSASMQECLKVLEGDLSIHSRPSKGTEISMTFPAAPVESEPVLLWVCQHRAQRETALRELNAGGLQVAATGDLRTARAWLDHPELGGVLVARGTCGPGLEEFLNATSRARVAVHLHGVRTGTASLGARALGFCLSDEEPHKSETERPVGESRQARPVGY